jgi:hypothetical protein
MRSGANGRDALRRVRMRREVISGGALLPTSPLSLACSSRHGRLRRTGATPGNNPRRDFSEKTLGSIPRFAMGNSRASQATRPPGWAETHRLLTVAFIRSCGYFEGEKTLGSIPRFAVGNSRASQATRPPEWAETRRLLTVAFIRSCGYFEGEETLDLVPPFAMGNSRASQATRPPEWAKTRPAEPDGFFCIEWFER